MIPLIFWGIIFALMELVFDAKRFQFEYIVLAFFKVLTGQSWAHLWYLYMLIGVYLALPLVRCIVKNVEYHQVGFIILIMFIFNSVIMDLFKFFDSEHSFAVQLPITSQYTDKKHVMCIGVLCSKPLYSFLILQHFLHFFRNSQDLRDIVAILPFCNLLSDLCKLNS